MDNSFFSTKMTYGLTDSGEDIENLASKHLSDTGIYVKQVRVAFKA